MDEKETLEQESILETLLGNRRYVAQHLAEVKHRLSVIIEKLGLEVQEIPCDDVKAELERKDFLSRDERTNRTLCSELYVIQNLLVSLERL